MLNRNLSAAVQWLIFSASQGSLAVKKSVSNLTNGLQLGSIIQRSGDVTQLGALSGLSPAQIERRMGFDKGRLNNGWHLLVLEQSVAPGEFKWGGWTDCSGGTDPVRTEEFGGQEYRVSVQDLKRWDLYKNSGFDDSEKEFAKHLALELQALNVRRGRKRIVKVIPKIPHDNNKFWLDQYPDAPRGAGMRQWTLLKRKYFRVKCFVPAGQFLPASL